MKDYQAFAEFLVGFVRDLNDRAEEGWSVLVEGQRDVKALRSIGFKGRIVTSSSLSSRGTAGIKKCVILTDLDREGAVLASRYVRLFARNGIDGSLVERRRLKAGSRGVFLHVENLSRFADPESARP
jgi:5S rRNA maturation endonuclease (ribonuclease M5)